MPDPILALVSFVGLFVYAVVGGAIGTLAVRAVDSIGLGYNSGNYLKGIAKKRGGDDDAWLGLFFAALLWPAVAALAVAGITLAGPIWLSGKVASYTAAAQIKEAE